MKFVGHYFPGLLRSTRFDDLPEQGEAADVSEHVPAAPYAGTRGLAIYLDPDTSVSAEAGTPWLKCSNTLPELGGRAQVAFIGGTMIEAKQMASEVERCSCQHVKPKTTILRRLWKGNGRDDMDELDHAAGAFDGFLVPTADSSDMALAFERTRRRVRRLVENGIERGWTAAPLIAMESPSPEFDERIPRGLCDYLVVESPPSGARYAAPIVIVPVEKDASPWWITSGNYLYSITGNRLWWASWMTNPLTFGVKSE